MSDAVEEQLLGRRMVESPLGFLTLCASDLGLTHLQFAGSQKLATGRFGSEVGSLTLDLAERMLAAYFSGAKADFVGLPLAARGTSFQRETWRMLREIPYGETRTYGEVARAIRRPRSARAVGLANNRNPLAIIVPCHRVVGHDGDLVGYGGGLDRKKYLLALERDVHPSFRREEAQLV